ncbi:MAG: NUDIX domain-containing protein [Candidatus Nanoarchaeia archaeon]
MRFERSCGAVVFKKNHDIRYLLLNNRGKWAFPKGLKEKEESDKETAMREVKEETGLKDLKLIDGFVYDSKFFYKWEGELVNKHATFFLFQAFDDDVKLSFEHEGYRWVSIDEALNLLKIKDYKDMIVKAHKFLQK